MPNGYRRGGQYQRNGRTHYRKGAKVASNAVGRWGLGGTDLAGLGVFLGACELTLRGAWAGLTLLWRGGGWAAGQLEAAEQRTAPKPRRGQEQHPMVFTLERDGANGWLAGDAMCKVHHSRRVARCGGCAAATKEQRQVTAGREAREARRASTSGPGRKR